MGEGECENSGTIKIKIHWFHILLVQLVKLLLRSFCTLTHTVCIKRGDATAAAEVGGMEDAANGIVTN